MDQPPIMARMTTATLTWSRYLQRLVAPFGITLKQAFVLRELARRDSLYPSQIAEMLYADRPTITVIVRNMARQGWVTREKDAQNRKYLRIRITEEGREKLATLKQSLAAETLFDPLACFDREEVQELEKLIGRLNEHLKKIGQERS